MATIYDETLEAWRRELRTTELQPIRSGFFKDVASYIRRLQESQRNLDAKSLKAVVIDEELARMRQLTTQLADRRLEKLKELAHGSKTNNLDPLEKWVSQDLADLSLHYQKFKDDLTQGREPKASPDRRKETLLVRFVKDVPSIIGVDLKTHGPFLKEDVATLPSDNAESLIRQGVAMEIRTPDEDNE